MANQATYVIAAFAISAVVLGWLLATSFLAMRRSEALARDLSVKD